MDITDASVQLLMNLCDKLGIAASHIYEVYVQAQVILAMGALAGWCTGILTFIIATILLRRVFIRPGVLVRTPGEDDKLCALFLAMICALVMGLIIGFVTYELFVTVLLPMMCPEYTATQALFGNFVSVVRATS